MFLIYFCDEIISVICRDYDDMLGIFVNEYCIENEKYFFSPLPLDKMIVE